MEDPDNGGIERVQLMSCWLDELTLQAFENGKITEDEFSGGFVGFKYLDTIKLTRVYKKIVFLMMGTLKK